MLTIRASKNEWQVHGLYLFSLNLNKTRLLPPAAWRPNMEGFVSDQENGDDVLRISLRKLLPRAKFFGGDDLTLSRLVSQPNEIQPGDALVILAECADPLAFACQAMARGACGIITEQLLPVPLVQCIVRDSGRTASKICNQLNENPASELLTIGVVGSSGKTTTALMVAAITRAAGFRTAYETDLGRGDGVVQSVPESRLTGPCQVSEFLTDARDAGSKVVVLELSDDFVRSSHFPLMNFDIVVLVGNNVSVRDPGQPSVLDLALHQVREGGIVVVNGDCRESLAASDRAGIPVLSYGMRNDVNVSAKIFEQHPGETTLMVTTGDVTAVMETPFTGPSMAASQLAALTVGMLMELPIHRAIDAITKIRTIPGRMQRVSHWDQASVVIDKSDNADRLGNSLRSLRRERCGGKLWVVASLGDNLSAPESAAMGRLAERYADFVIVTADEQGREPFLQKAHCWLDGVDKVSSPRLIADQKTAILWAMTQAKSGDTVLLTGRWKSESPEHQRRDIEAAIRLLGDVSREEHEAEPTILPHPSLYKSA